MEVCYNATKEIYIVRYGYYWYILLSVQLVLPCNARFIIHSYSIFILCSYRQFKYPIMAIPMRFSSRRRFPLNINIIVVQHINTFWFCNLINKKNKKENDKNLCVWFLFFHILYLRENSPSLLYVIVRYWNISISKMVHLIHHHVPQSTLHSYMTSLSVITI